MQNEPIIRALDVCLQQIQGGSTLEQVLDTYPEWQTELIPPLESAQTLIAYAGTLAIPETAQTSDRTDFLESAQQIQQTINSNARFYRWRSRIFKLTIIVVMLAAGLWLTIFSVRALPGDWLYPIKELYRQARYLSTLEPDRRLNFDNETDAERMQEIQTLLNMKRSGPALFSGIINSVQDNLWNVGGLMVKINPETQMIGQVRPEVYVEITGNLLPDGTIEAVRVTPREYIITGPIQRLSENSLLLGGISIQITPDTIIPHEPNLGDRAVVRALRLADGSLTARVLDTTSADN